MNNEQLNPVVLTEEDYRLLKPYAGSLQGNRKEMSLAYELGRAVIVPACSFPKHGVRLNSRVSVLDMSTQKVLEFTIVLPEHADIRQQKISVLTPMGAALIGLRQSEQVQWKVPAGLKRFLIQDVVNP